MDMPYYIAQKTERSYILRIVRHGQKIAVPLLVAAMLFFGITMAKSIYIGVFLQEEFW